MKPTIAILICFLMLTGQLTFAQNAHFATQGVVEFDKTINMFALIKKNIDKDNESWYGPMFEQYKKTQPQFKTYKSTLSFAGNNTMFTPIEPDPAPNTFYSNDPMAVQNNTIFTNLTASSVIMEKHVFDEVFLVKDSTRRINWKITTETRDVAGYKCRRANAIVMDSIYVVAFYTDEIAVSGGPESFTGLPGMILGVALPHENVTWFATKVSETVVPVKDMAPPKHGKPTTRKGLMDILKGATKDWGDYAKSYLKSFNL